MSVEALLPNLPLLFAPHAHIVPLVLNAKLWHLPAETAHQSVIFPTMDPGEERLVPLPNVLFPNCPTVLSPQVHMVQLLLNPIVCLIPDET